MKDFGSAWIQKEIEIDWKRFIIVDQPHGYKPKKPNLLITGGTGFIGSHLAKYAIQNGWSVTSISINKPRKKIILMG